MKRLRVLVAKPGLDGHDRGAKVLAHALRDAGMEVIYTGLHQSAEKIAVTAAQEDVDVICVSILSGAHGQVFSDLARELKIHQASDIPVLAGGIIPADDIPHLKSLGVREVFLPGTPLATLCHFIQNLGDKERG